MPPSPSRRTGLTVPKHLSARSWRDGSTSRASFLTRDRHTPDIPVANPSPPSGPVTIQPLVIARLTAIERYQTCSTLIWRKEAFSSTLRWLTIFVRDLLGDHDSPLPSATSQLGANQLTQIDLSDQHAQPTSPPLNERLPGLPHMWRYKCVMRLRSPTKLARF